ncbi:hypothetical protein GCM10007275_17130 [Jeotgalicoccus coquinae]|uniref:Stress response protein YsnF n=1 Tax=Jeotgalicoccus coquinae TaxID=709509 RepID=A0A6V7R0M9_9STAP|nr:DUF2382 domain-containing protein [Jeotgalicoccus coquinae]MBB6423792.1 uncharacterized protein (TIGR02271 family) [Jeotgalicoccus coquinae]GGE22600.1 hypothetical protein GCM10007275_17130 [Jeotgalicoccus coquinae]CAD2070638.1 Stress response protein YsnF [Jeotgalicoccus coquinae]
MSRIENFVTENDALTRAEELRAEGVAERDITVLSKQPITNDAFADSGVNFQDAEGSAWDKFVSFFSPDNPEEKVLNDLGLGESEQVQYRNALNAGEVLVYVEEQGNRDDNAMNYGEKRDSYNYDKTADVTGAGLAGSAAANNNYNNDNDYVDSELDARAVDREGELTEEEKIQLREERVNVDKENVQTGEVTVDKHVETDRQKFDIPVEREEVVIERNPVDDVPAKGGFNDRDDVDEVRIPVNEERVNVDKENVVNEEVTIRKETHEDVEHVSEEVRREELDVHEDDFNKDNLRKDGLRDRDDEFRK